MKLKKTIFVFVILLSSHHSSLAQGIERAKFLFYRMGIDGIVVLYDSVKITKISNDTTWFSVNKVDEGGYYRVGLKVYREAPAWYGTVLYYDYSLDKNDTFISFWGVGVSPPPDTFIVDSVYYRKMNHRTFKAWHLSRNRWKDKTWEWIEGLGELSLGWDTKSYGFTESAWEVKGICLNDSVIYWKDSTWGFKPFEDREPMPSCSFDSIIMQLGVKNIANNAFSIYPNPASDIITINASSAGVMSITDFTGRTCLESIPFREGAQAFDISALKEGVYLVVLQMSDRLTCKRICVVRH